MVKKEARKVVLKDAQGGYLVPVIDPADKGGSGGSGLEVCDIGMALYVDETKGLRRYLNGQIVDINTNTQAFLNRLQQITTLHPSLLCTEEEWQTAKTMSAFGQVGKFVFNYADDGTTIVSVRIPRVVNVQGLLDLSNLGLRVDEKLPNITGTTNNFLWGNQSLVPDGAFTRGENYTQAVEAGSKSSASLPKILFNASLSSSTYQDNAPVQQEAIQYPYFIQIATGSETENNIINDIELNNPYSLFECKYADHELFNLSWLVSNGSYNGSNAVHPSAYQALLVENNAEVAIGSTVTLPSGINYTKQGLSVKLSTETYTDYDFVVNPADETFRPPIKPNNLNNTRYLIETGEQDGISYRIYSDGYCEQWGTKVPSQASWKEITLIKTYRDTNYLVLTSCNGNVNGTGNWSTVTDGQAYTTSSIKILGVNANTSWLIAWKTCGYLAEGEYSPLTDNISLYYYVGETVQNANLIDAGRIGELVATKTDMLQASGAGMPSNNYIDLTLGASGSTYTAPANGWFIIQKRANATTSQYLRIDTYNGFSQEENSSSPNNNLSLFLPVKKGGAIYVSYDVGGTTGLFRFYYAEGSK